MDVRNLFLTPITYRLLRLEYAAGLLAAVVALLAHFSDVRWVPFVGLFVVIDLVGYLPGALAWHRADGQQISRVFYVLYNTMHSLVTAALIVGGWVLFFGAEWALLALPIHLFGDRAIFGNFAKPFGLSFEPRPHPAYVEFRSRYDQHPDTVPAAVAVSVRAA
jgi:hypothetical protein